MKQHCSSTFQSQLTLTLVTGLTALTFAEPAWAHHPTGGEMPSNLLEGLLSGLGHPVIGMDHLAVIVASGLIAAATQRGAMIPLGFVLATMAGTAIHLQDVMLPVVEAVIAISVIGMGGLLIMLQREKTAIGYSLLITLGSAIAGIFHGYAYGEAIIGAEMTPLIAYLAGFTIIQLAIACGSYFLVQTGLQHLSSPELPLKRLFGCGIMGMGIVFLTSV